MSLSDNTSDNSVLDIRSIKKTDDIKTIKPEEPKQIVEPSTVGQLSPEDKKKQLEVRMNSAKFYGTKEMKKFEELTNKYISDVNELVLFEGTSDILQEMFIDNILKSYTEPLFKGQRPYGMPEDIFRQTRAEMFKKIIKKYVNKGE